MFARACQALKKSTRVRENPTPLAFCSPKSLHKANIANQSIPLLTIVGYAHTYDLLRKVFIIEIPIKGYIPMAADDKALDTLKANLITQMRFMSANFVMHSQTIADKAGIHSTDNECLDFLLLHGPASAGQLAVLTGLTTGAVTAMIDRLEKAGFVERQRDRSDRRKVLVVPNLPHIMAEVAPYSVPMSEALEHLFGEFSAAELETILRCTTRFNTVATEVIAALRKAP